MRGKPLLSVFFTVFLDLLGFGILIPVFPLLISPGSPFRVTPESWSFTEGLIMLGWLQAAYPLASFIAAPILGQLSDRFGRRPVLALSIFGTALGYMLFAVGISTASIPLLFAARALDGFTGGNIAVAQAAIGDISDDSNRARNFGLIGAAFGLGFIIGPYLGGKLSSPNTSFYGLFDTPSWFGATTPFWFAAILSLTNCALILGAFPETLREKSAQTKLNVMRSVQNVITGFSSDRLRVVLASAFLWNAGFTFFTTFFGVYLRNEFGYSASQTGDYFAIVGLFIAISQAVLVGRVAKSFSDYKVLRFSFFGLASMMLLYFVTPTSTTFWIYAIIPFFTASNGLSIANVSSLVSRSALPGQQGQALGVLSSVQNLAQVPASILVGYITSGITSSQPLLVSTICIASAGVVFTLFFRPKYVGPAVGSPAHPA
ncbi:MAG: TCR/Tet family MFS transporter [Actinobacteria bacterium]|nr:TCR/Tet family MFS transporter [Actinomycetota bacterium]